MLLAVGQPLRLRQDTRTQLLDSANEVFVSAVSVWEAAIKRAQGKLDVDPADLLREIEIEGFSALQITYEHAIAAGALPPHHKDPFDRMLIAQAQLESLTLVTSDREFAAYGVALLPA